MQAFMGETHTNVGTHTHTRSHTILSSIGNVDWKQPRGSSSSRPSPFMYAWIGGRMDELVGWSAPLEANDPCSPWYLRKTLVGATTASAERSRRQAEGQAASR